MSYSSDVFFKPWVGLDYPYGWCLDTDNNVCCEKQKQDEENKQYTKSLKVMVLGKEHYCKGTHNMYKNIEEKTVFDSTDYSNAGHNPMKCCYSNCAHLFTCKDKTESVIKEHVFADDEEAAKAMDVWWQYDKSKKKNSYKKEATKVSHANFEKIFNATQNNLETKDIWNSLLFSNFFQRGMPNEEGNDDFHISTERERACKAFADILKTHAPDIVWAWNVEEYAIFQSIKEKYSTLKDNKVTIDCLEQVNSKYNYEDLITGIFVPRLHILQQNEHIHNSRIYVVGNGQQDLIVDKKKIITKRDLPFLVLKYKDKNGNNHKTLMVFSYHPSAANQYFDIQLYSQYLKIIFKDYNNIINWDCSPNPNNTYFPQNPRLTMIYDSKLTLLNPQN